MDNLILHAREAEEGDGEKEKKIKKRKVP